MLLRRIWGRQPLLVRFSSQHTNYPLKKIREIGETHIGESVQIKARTIASDNVANFSWRRKEIHSGFSLQGWVRNTRTMKQLFFCDVNDGSSHNNLQVLISREKRRELPTLGFGAAVVASGKINVAPKGNFELFADEFQMIGTFLESVAIQ